MFPPSFIFPRTWGIWKCSPSKASGGGVGALHQNRGDIFMTFYFYKKKITQNGKISRVGPIMTCSLWEVLIFNIGCEEMYPAMKNWTKRCNITLVWIQANKGLLWILYTRLANALWNIKQACCSTLNDPKKETQWVCKNHSLPIHTASLRNREFSVVAQVTVRHTSPLPLPWYSFVPPHYPPGAAHEN